MAIGMQQYIGRRLHYAPIHRNAAITAKIHSLMRLIPSNAV